MEFIPPAPFGFSRLIKVKPIYPTKAPSIPVKKVKLTENELTQPTRVNTRGMWMNTNYTYRGKKIIIKIRKPG